MVNYREYNKIAFPYNQKYNLYSTLNPVTKIFFCSENQLNPTIQTNPLTKIRATTIAIVENEASELEDKNAGNVAITAVTNPIKTPANNSIKYSFMRIKKIDLVENPTACITAISRRRSKIVRARITANPIVPRIKPSAPSARKIER